MKIARTIGLAAVAALALMASAGAGSAAALETTLCKTATDSPYCKSEERYPAKTAFKASSSKVTLDSSLPDIICTSSAIEGETVTEAGQPQQLTFSNWSLEGCTLKVPLGEKTITTKCTTPSTGIPPYSGALSRTQGSKGELTIAGSGSKPGWTVTCGGFISCTYSMTAKLALEFNLIASAEPMGPVKGTCPANMTFNGTYTLSSPTPPYVAIPGGPPAKTTGLCKSAFYTYCEPEDLYPKGTEIQTEPASELTFTTDGALGAFKCKEVKLQPLTTTVAYGEPLTVEGGEMSFPNGCHPASPGVKCVTKAISGSEENVISLGEGGGGYWWLGGTTWSMDCTYISKCTFTSYGGFTLRPGPGPSLEAFAIPVKITGLCGKTGTLSAIFPVTSPTPLYVTANVVR